MKKIHPDGYISDMRLYMYDKIWEIISIHTSSKTEYHPHSREYEGFKYKCKDNNNIEDFHESIIKTNKGKFVTIQNNPEYFL